MNPIKLEYPIPALHEPGFFGTERKFDIHTGIDLYCSSGTEVYAIESGIVVKIEIFTGEEVGSPWWNTTHAVLIEGESGVIVYGEITPESRLKVGDILREGDLIGIVEPVLKVQKTHIPRHMLHLELMTKGSRDTLIWELNSDKPECLLNPLILLDNFGNARVL